MQTQLQLNCFPGMLLETLQLRGSSVDVGL